MATPYFAQSNTIHAQMTFPAPDGDKQVHLDNSANTAHNPSLLDNFKLFFVHSTWEEWSVDKAQSAQIKDFDIGKLACVLWRYHNEGTVVLNEKEIPQGQPISMHDLFITTYAYDNSYTTQSGSTTTL